MTLLRITLARLILKAGNYLGRLLMGMEGRKRR